MKEAINTILDRCKHSFSKQASCILPYCKEVEKTQINVQSFQKITPKEQYNQCIFIDGGNNVLLHTSSVHIQLQRIGYVHFSGLKKEKQETFEYLLLTQTKVKDDNLHIVSQVIPFRELPDTFITAKEWSYEDDTLHNENKLVEASSLIRKWNERLIILHLLKTHKETLFVLDGTIMPKQDYDEELNNMIKQKSMEKQCSIISCAKTSSIFVDNGNVASLVLSMQSPYDTWYYTPVCKIRLQYIQRLPHIQNMFVKLHSYAKHIFFIETLYTHHHLHSIVNTLAQHAKDIAFPGYPYGLLVVDRIARVSDEYASFLKSMMLHRYTKLETLAATQDAHEILDTM